MTATSPKKHKQTVTVDGQPVTRLIQGVIVKPDSATFGLVNEIYRTDLDRNLMVIPAFVFHAHQNIGTTDALFVSMPTRAYQHDDPDVFRYPIDSGEVPYRFDNRQGW